VKSIRAKHIRRTGVGALTAALCLVLAPSATSLAAGIPGSTHPAGLSRPPDGLSWATYRRMMAQAPLDAAATKIQAMAAKPGPAHRGFFETAVNDRKRILTVYWHGAVPADMRRLIGRLRATVDIRVVKTRYSLATLNRYVLTAIRSGRGVDGGSPLTDGSGIALSVNSPNTRLVASAMRSRFGVPVVVTRGGPDYPEYCVINRYGDHLGPGSRCWDLEPFWGGDVIQSNYGYGCTGGFGVHNSAGGEYLLTAAHCAYNGSAYVNGVTFYNGQDPSNWQLVGQITDVPGSHDLAVIPTGSGNQYYDGPGAYRNSDTTRTKTVAGQQATSVGDVVCESGAFGGTLCPFTVHTLNFSEKDSRVPSVTWTALAEATSSHGNFPIPGDSGGPWFSLDGSTHVWAKGILHGLWPGTGTELYAVFTPITVATSDIGVTVNTG
jgi:hypothetical protein